MGGSLLDRQREEPIAEDMQLGVHAARLLAKLKAAELAASLLQWLDGDNRWRRREAARLLIAIDGPPQPLRDRILAWLRSAESADWQLAGGLLAKHALLDEEILRQLTAWWLSSDLQFNNLGAKVLGAALGRDPKSQPLFANILRSELATRGTLQRGLAARHLFVLGYRDSDVVDALIEGAFSENGRVAHLWEFLQDDRCTKEPAIIQVIARMLDSPDATQAEQAYTILRERDLCVDARKQWLRRELHNTQPWARISAAVELTYLDPDSEGTRTLVDVLTCSHDHPDSAGFVRLAAETLLNVGREKEPAVAALRGALANGPDSDAIEAADLLHKYESADESLSRLISKWLQNQADDESHVAERMKSLLRKMGQTIPAPPPEQVIERQLRILASPEAERRGDDAWTRIQRQLSLLDSAQEIPSIRPNHSHAWWPTAARINSRAAGLAEQFPKVPPRFASLLVRLALPDAPAELLPWLLGPRHAPSAALSEQLARLVSIEKKDLTGRFASAFWFSHLSSEPRIWS
jgi:hypothetical protein